MSAAVVIEHRLVGIGHSTWDGYWWGSCTCGWHTPPNSRHGYGYWGPLSRDAVESYFAEHQATVTVTP